MGIVREAISFTRQAPDPRVREAIFDMKDISIKRFENYRRTGQI